MFDALMSHLQQLLKGENKMLKFNLQLDYRKIASMYGNGMYHQPNSLHSLTPPHYISIPILRNIH